MADLVEELVAHVARGLVSKPDEVRVVRSERGGDVLFELHVAAEDVGKVIGRGGRTVRSLRTLVRASGAKVDERHSLEIAG